MGDSYEHINLGQQVETTKTAPVQTNTPAQTTTTVKIILGLLITLVFVALAVAVAAMVLLSGEIRERKLQTQDQIRERKLQTQDQIRERKLQNDRIHELEMKLQDNTMPNGGTSSASTSVPPTKPADKPPVLSSGGAVYVRWGRTLCSSNNTELVYAGVAGGTFYNSRGGASNYVCLTRKPVWANFKDGVQGGGHMFGAEYDMYYYDIFKPAHDLYNHDVPCAVCRSVTYTSMVMIPGTTVCTSGWQKAYSGYLMSENSANDNHYRTEYVCVDGNAEVVVGGGADKNGVSFFVVEARCGSLQCPPYVEGRELTCVVCLK